MAPLPGLEPTLQFPPSGLCSGGARLGAHPDAVVSERYFYAFGYPCRAEAATEVVEQDFDSGGTEVSRHYRSWFPDPRDRSVGSAEGDSHA